MLKYILSFYLITYLWHSDITVTDTLFTSLLSPVCCSYTENLLCSNTCEVFQQSIVHIIGLGEINHSYIIAII